MFTIVYAIRLPDLQGLVGDLFGWFVAIRGFLLIAVPATVESGVDATMLSPTALTVARVFFGVLAVIGLLLTYDGWFRPVR